MSNDRYDKYDDESLRNRREASRRRGSKHRHKKKRHSLKAKFFMVLFIVLLIYCVSALAYFGYQYYIEDNDAVPDSNGEKAGIIEQLVKPKLKERTVFLLLGTDKDGDRTDTIMVCCYNEPLDELTIISIPRDTLIEVSDEQFAMLNEEYPEPGQKGMKINAITHYGLETYGIPILENEIEEMIGVPIDYYCKISFDAFNYLIDSIGGVQYNVPINMDYDDPGQDLSIHLKAGLQTLNGEQAQGLVRFRHTYAEGDIKRVQVQQDFCKELLSQLVSKDVFFKNIRTYLTTLYRYVETDVKLTDAVKYMSVVKDFNPNNTVTYTIPGYGGTLYGITGGYVLDEQKLDDFCYDIFQKPVDQIKAERLAEAQSGGSTEQVETTIDDKTLNIQVLNGGYTNGKASDVQSQLISAGYNVTSIGTHTGEKTDNTRIFVKSKGMGKSLQSYFANSEIVVDPSMTTNHDIVVVIGINE